MSAFIRLTSPILLAAALAIADPAPRRGGVLHVVQRAEPKTFNPVLALDAPSRDILRRINADLISIDRRTQLTTASLAASWTQTNGGRTYVLKLRRGVRFSDGEPFTADDVVFSFQLYLDPKIGSPQRDLLRIEDHDIECRKLDAWTVQFDLPQPYAAAERLFDTVAILPKHRLEKPWLEGKLHDAWTLATPVEAIVGLGPFQLQEYRPGDRVVLKRNPYYWKAGLPLLDSIEFRSIPDEDAQVAHFVGGNLDILNRLSTKAIQFLDSRGGVVTDLGPGLDYNFLCFNLSENSPKLMWFGRREFRQALSLAVDRDAMARIIFGNRATPIWGHVTPGNKLWYSTQIPHPARDLHAARRLLRQAGVGPNQRVEFSILTSASSPERIQMATMLQADWKEIGIDVHLVTVEFRSMIDRVMKKRQFDTCILGLGGGDADPNAEMNVWLSYGATHLWDPNQPHPSTAWEAEIDRLMRRQMITLDYSERKKLYDRVQQIVADQLPMVFLVSPHVVVAQRGNLGNFRPAILDHQTLWNAEELYFKGGPQSGR